MESAAKIKEILQAASMEKLPEFIAEYENDPRSGVQNKSDPAENGRRAQRLLITWISDDPSLFICRSR